MLRTIVSITGKPGLFKIISQGRNMLLVEDLTSKKRVPAYSRDRLISLGDIAMYTEGEDLPLGEILDRLYAKNEGKTLDVKAIVADGTLRDKFAEVVEDFDRERVHDSDIKKLFTWYNILVGAGFDKFSEEEEVAEDETPEEEA